MNKSISHQIAEFAINLKYEDVLEEVTQVITNSLWQQNQ